MPRLRPVLKGVLYRSGSPSDVGLEQLCQRGWKRVYSLYGEHTTQSGPRNQNMLRHGHDLRTCAGEQGSRQLEWRSAPSSRMRSLPAIFRDVIESIRKPDHGPVLVHCWNGLHYAGMVSALALRQFCGLTAEQAEAYWRANANRGANYPLIIQNLYSFKPLPELALTPEEQAEICPDLNKSLLVSSETFGTRSAEREPLLFGGEQATGSGAGAPVMAPMLPLSPGPAVTPVSAPMPAGDGSRRAVPALRHAPGSGHPRTSADATSTNAPKAPPPLPAKG